MTKKYRIVLDTNILVSGTFFPKGNEARLLQHVFEGNITLSSSLEILEEFREVLSRDKFELTTEELQTIFEKIVSWCGIVLSTRQATSRCRDPDDQKFLDCAVAAKADYLVTGDPDLLTMKKADGSEIVTAGKLVNKLKNL